jgi:tetratricopeptide (TPR) repeat protein
MPATEKLRSGVIAPTHQVKGERVRRCAAPTRRVAVLLALLVTFWPHVLAQQAADPDKLLHQAERLAWLKAWTKAEPLYNEAERLFAARGDRRDALFAEVNALRGELPRLAVPDVSQRLADYLDDPIVQHDDALRLRCLTIKGETDEDLDPSLANDSWREALEIAMRLGDERWANRARGELGVVAFQLGDINASIVQLSQAMAVAQKNGDTPSLIRWLTLFGDGYTQLGRPQQALDFYDEALKAASTIPEMQFPVMTYVGKGDALASLGRFPEAEQLLTAAQAIAEREHALGYQAELTMTQADIALRRKATGQALPLLARAADLARRAGGDRLLAEVDLRLAQTEVGLQKPAEADRALQEGIAAARRIAEPLMLPRLLAERADLRISQRRYTDARNLLDEASDLLEGLFTKVSSPWVRSRVIGGMDLVFATRIRLEATHESNPARAFGIVEEARGRSLLDLMLSTPVASVPKTPELRARERDLAALQTKLLRSTDRSERRRLLEQVFLAEDRLAIVSTELFDRTHTVARKPLDLHTVQRALRPDEVFVEFALGEPDSFSLVVTRTTARLQRLPARAAIAREVEPVLKAVQAGSPVPTEVRTAGATLLAIPELATKPRLVISPDGDLNNLPFELLTDATGKPLLDSHVVSYTPNGSVLAILRREPSAPVTQMALAVGASEVGDNDGTAKPAPGDGSGIPRGVYDLDVSKLPPLPSASDEAKAVASLLGPARSVVLLGDAASEEQVKKEPLQDFGVLHFAAHGILSTKVPSRSALLLRAGGADDGLLQAGEILQFRLHASLVTLSACDTGAGAIHGQDGVSSLVRPFLAAGAHAVVANLWTADDQFSLALMREFYTRLAAGEDVATALRDAKLKMLAEFGPQAVPKLWSGVLAYGDGAAVVHSRRAGK